jgi:CheY-like chemotaxis protein/anti-sigma regulatory factor (Ser/Thr protein kinase)
VVRSDIRLLRSIIQNFLSNAIRYTRQGRVLLGCRRCAGGLRIEVWDTGLGIPPDKFDEIFEEFRQLDTGGAAHDRGIGLGLAIVRRAAKMLDLPIQTRSIVGRGSVFSVTVPLGHKRPATVHRTASRKSLGALADPMLLVIDDDHSILAGMQAMLEGWGCTAAIAASGDEALDLLGRLPRPPDMVIADYHLNAETTGITEICRIRQAMDQPVPGIIITANHAPAVQALVQQHGLWLLRKPLNPAQLRALLTQLLAQPPA